MDKQIEQLDKILIEIFQEAERRLKIEQIDLDEFDETIDEQDLRGLREKVVQYKADQSFWEEDIPKLTTLLKGSIERLQSYRTDLTEIGGKNLPNEDIINLITQGILTIETPISKTFKNKEFTGHLTADGYLELNVTGIKRKLSLRRAALFAYGSDPSNQWTFWEAQDINGEKKPLEHFRRLLRAADNN